MKALQCDDVSEVDKAKLNKNLAACYLRLKKYKNVLINADLCLSISPKDENSRCTAYQTLGEVEKSYTDALAVKIIQPGNRAVEDDADLCLSISPKDENSRCTAFLNSW